MNFTEIEQHVPRNVAGIYEIHTRAGVRLKVGIAGDLRKRLRTHRASRQSGLRLCAGGEWTIPAHVVSKSSILAKHLFFDSSLTGEYDLRTEVGRRGFLLDQCTFTFEILPTRAEAAVIEAEREGSGAFRYVGRAITR